MPNLSSVTSLSVFNSSVAAKDTRTSNKRVMSGIDDTRASLAEGITARTQRGAVNAVQTSLTNLISLSEVRKAGLEELSQILSNLTQVLHEARDLDATLNAAGGARTKQILTLVASFDAVLSGTKYGSIDALAAGAGNMSFIGSISHAALNDPAMLSVANPVITDLSSPFTTGPLDFTTQAGVDAGIVACESKLTTLTTALDVQTATIELATQLKAHADTRGANLDVLTEECLATDVSKESAIAREAQYQLNLVAAMMGIVDEQNDTRISILRS